MQLDTHGTAWHYLLAESQRHCGPPTLADQDGDGSTCLMSKALVAARLDNSPLRREVADTLALLADGPPFRGRALALGRELIGYVIAADVIDLRQHDAKVDARFRARLAELMTTHTTGGPATLIECHEQRANNWGTHCGASRIAVAAYLGDAHELDRAARVFKGFLGDRDTYAGFVFGDLSWQCDPDQPVPLNPRGCARNGRSLDGVLPDDQRRAGRFRWPAPKENYVYEALQGAVAQAVILERRGYPAFSWGDKALLRSFEWLYDHAHFPATGDDAWLPGVINYYYRTRFAVDGPSRPGKNVGWTDWTHQP